MALQHELDMAFNYAPVTYGEIKDGKGKAATPKMRMMLEEATTAERDCVGAWNRLFNNGGNKRMFFNSILCHNHRVLPTISAGHGDLFDYENKTLVSAMDLIHGQCFPEDFDFIKPTFGNINYVCGMSVPPLMIKRVVTRLLEEGVFNVNL